jgi:high frequency lysogenization protein
VNQLENQTLALAGMFQAAVLIDELAVSGNCDGEAFDGSFDSLFTFDADSTEAVFGQVTCLHSGFRALTDYLGGETRGSSRNIAYYVLSMMKLATRILSDPALSEQLFDGLQEIERRGSEFELPRSSIISKIDGLYQDTISQLEPRILVRGEQNHLLNNDTAARIRSLLLAGVATAGRQQMEIVPGA